MTITEKYGFGFSPIEANSNAVKYYVKDHLEHFQYPPDITPSSTMWFAVCREDSVWAVVGIKFLSERSVEIPDFYCHRSRWGKLACYAALETLKQLADERGIEVITVTPVWNVPQMRAQAKAFGVDGPTHHVYRYRPEGWKD